VIHAPFRGFQEAGSSSGVMAAASRSRRKSQRRPTRRAGRSPRRASSYAVERGMPSSSATSLVDMTSVRVSGRAARLSIYIREVRSRQSGPPGPTPAGASGPSQMGSLQRECQKHGNLTLWVPASMATPAECRNHAVAEGAANPRRLLLLVRSATHHPPSGWSAGEKGSMHCPRLSEFLLPLHVHLPGASQPTSRAGPRRLGAEPRRDWARR
jgi:hypothetical protein